MSVKDSIDENIVPTISNKVQQFEQKAAGVLDIIGSKIEVDSSGKPKTESWKDLAKSLQIYSDKRYETARYFFIKNGECIRHVAVSSQTPSSTLIRPDKDFLYKLKDYAEQTGSQIVFCHNHPSGFIMPSSQDIEITDYLKNFFDTGNFDKSGNETNKKYFAGHVILDHGTYGIYTPENEWLALIDNKFSSMQKVAENYVIPSSQYNIQIKNEKDLVSISNFVKTYIDSGAEFNKENWIPVAFATVNGIVKNIELISVNEFINYQTLQTKLKNIGRENNSESIYFVPYKNQYKQMQLCEQFAKTTGLVKDIYFENDINGYDLSNYSGGSLFSTPININELQIDDTAIFSEKTINEAKEKNASKNIKSEIPSENTINNSKETIMSETTNQAEALFQENNEVSTQESKSKLDIGQLKPFDFDLADDIFNRVEELLHIDNPTVANDTELKMLSDYCDRLANLVDVSKLQPYQAAQFRYILSVAMKNPDIPDEKLEEYKKKEAENQLLVEEYKREEEIDEKLTQEAANDIADAVDELFYEQEIRDLADKETDYLKSISDIKEETADTLILAAGTDLKGQKVEQEEVKQKLLDTIKERGAEFRAAVNLEYLKLVAKQSVIKEYNLTPEQYNEIANKYGRITSAVADKKEKMTPEELKVLSEVTERASKQLLAINEVAGNIVYKDTHFLEEAVTAVNATTTQKALVKDVTIVMETGCKPNKKLKEHWKSFSEKHPKIAKATKIINNLGFGVVKTAVISATLGAPGLAVYSAFNTVNTIRKSYKRYKENGIEREDGKKKNFGSFLKHLGERNNRAELIGFVGQIAATAISTNFAFGLNIAGITNRQVASAVTSATIGVVKGINAQKNKKYARTEIQKIFEDAGLGKIPDHLIKDWSKIKSPVELEQNIKSYAKKDEKLILNPEQIQQVKELAVMYKNNNVAKATSMNILAAAAGLATNAQVRDFIKDKFDSLTPNTNEIINDANTVNQNITETLQETVKTSNVQPEEFTSTIDTTNIVNKTVIEPEIIEEPITNVDFQVGDNVQNQEFVSTMQPNNVNVDEINVKIGDLSSENIAFRDMTASIQDDLKEMSSKIENMEVFLSEKTKYLNDLKEQQDISLNSGVYTNEPPAMMVNGDIMYKPYLSGGSFEEDFRTVSRHIEDGKVSLDNISSTRITETFASATANNTLDTIKDNFARGFMSSKDKILTSHSDSFESFDLMDKQFLTEKINQTMAIMELDKKGYDVSNAMEELKAELEEYGFKGDIENIIPKEMVVDSSAYSPYNPADLSKNIEDVEKEIETLKNNLATEQKQFDIISKTANAMDEKIEHNNAEIASLETEKLGGNSSLDKAVASEEKNTTLDVESKVQESASTPPNINNLDDEIDSKISEITKEKLELENRLQDFQDDKVEVENRLSSIQNSIKKETLKLNELKNPDSNPNRFGIYSDLKDGHRHLNGYQTHDDFLNVNTNITNGQISLDNISISRMTSSYVQALNNEKFNLVRDTFARNTYNVDYNSLNLPTQQYFNEALNRCMAIMELEKKGYDISKALEEFNTEYGIDGDLRDLIPQEMIVNAKNIVPYSPDANLEEIAKIEQTIESLNKTASTEQRFLDDLDRNIDSTNSKILEKNNLVASLEDEKLNIASSKPIEQTTIKPLTTVMTEPEIKPIEQVASVLKDNSANNLKLERNEAILSPETNLNTKENSGFPDVFITDYANSLKDETVLTQNVDSLAQETLRKDEEEKRKSANKNYDDIAVSKTSSISDNFSEIPEVINNVDTTTEIEPAIENSITEPDIESAKKEQSKEVETNTVSENLVQNNNSISMPTEENLKGMSNEQLIALLINEKKEKSILQSEKVSLQNQLEEAKKNTPVQTEQKTHQTQESQTTKLEEQKVIEPENAINFDTKNAYEKFTEVPAFGLLDKETGKWEEINNAKFNSINDKGQIVLSVEQPDGKQKAVIVEPAYYEQIIKQTEKFNKEIKEYGVEKDSASYKVSLEELRASLNLDKDSFRLNTCANFQHNFGILCKKNPGLSFSETMKLADEILISKMGAWNQSQLKEVSSKYPKKNAEHLRKIYDNSVEKELAVSESIKNAGQKIDKTIYKLGDVIKISFNETNDKNKAYQIASIDTKNDKIILIDPETKEQLRVPKAQFIQRAQEIKKNMLFEQKKLRQNRKEEFGLGR